MLKSVLFPIACLASITAFAAESQKEVKSGDMSFQWKIEGNLLQGTIRAKTEGWVSVGFNPTKAMKDGMFVIGSVTDGKAVVENHFGTEKGKHVANKDLGCKETLTNTSAKRDGAFTEVSFTMPIDFDDKCSKPLSLDKDTKLILAYGSSSKLTSGHPFVRKITVNLKTGAQK
jgi:hypothetical protein